jgi:glycosyltransferase involved in cell wall biosynthesis
LSHGGPPVTPRTVAVCIPARNAGSFLAETIESVLSQTLQDFEVLVCDNASSDETPAICARYLTRGLRYRRFEQLVGQAGNWNRCRDLAAAPLVVLLHADDTLEPTFLGRAVGLMEAHPSLAMVHCSVRHVTSEGREIAVQQLFSEDRVVTGEDFFERMLAEGCLVNPAGVMIRATKLQRAGRFSERIRWGIDWHMWLRLCLEGDIGYLAEPLARYRQHAASGTTSVLTSGRVASDEVWVVRDVVALRGSGRESTRALLAAAQQGVAHRVFCHAEQALLSGRRAAASRGLLDAVRTNPRLLTQRKAWGLAAGVALGRRAYRWLLARR